MDELIIKYHKICELYDKYAKVVATKIDHPEFRSYMYTLALVGEQMLEYENELFERMMEH